MPRRAAVRMWLAILTIMLGEILCYPAAALAQTPPADTEFYLQVTPSPLVTTVKPGVPTELELKIRNAGSATETLKAELKRVKIDDLTGEPQLDETTPPEIAPWVNLSAPVFAVKSGAVSVQKIRIALPAQAGFSYTFAVLVSRKDNPKPTQGGRLLKGSVAVFALINVDKPGATRKLEVTKFTASRGVYEYLPAEMEISFKNTGNSIVQPYGNIFMQRTADDKAPITALPVNSKLSYIIPGSTRTLKATWTDGFPIRKDDKLVWNWADLADLRVGRYTAKLVAVYNDGRRDVPVEQPISFWVVPWKILGGILLAILLMLAGITSIIWNIKNLVRRSRRRRQPPPDSADS
jgi:hypothetical protein